MSVLIPKSSKLIVGKKGRLTSLEKQGLKESRFRDDCDKLGFKNCESKLRYSNLLLQLSEAMPDINAIIDLEMKYHRLRKLLSIRYCRTLRKIALGIEIIS